ncbi:MAG: hypothetical protein MR503_05900 [Oscillospiraceae bacterium]|nr:hypothetical protein [Oscillospiraceae bacterium]
MDELMTNEITESEEEDKKITSEESGDIIDMVRSKHESGGERSEHFGDVLVMQITLCIILLLILAAANIIKPGFAESFTGRFREMTGGEPEEIFEKAVVKAIRMING